MWLQLQRGRDATRRDGWRARARPGVPVAVASSRHPPSRQIFEQTDNTSSARAPIALASTPLNPRRRNSVLPFTYLRARAQSSQMQRSRSRLITRGRGTTIFWTPDGIAQLMMRQQCNGGDGDMRAAISVRPVGHLHSMATARLLGLRKKNLQPRTPCSQ